MDLKTKWIFSHVKLTELERDFDQLISETKQMFCKETINNQPRETSIESHS